MQDYIYFLIIFMYEIYDSTTYTIIHTFVFKWNMTFVSLTRLYSTLMFNKMYVDVAEKSQFGISYLTDLRVLEPG